MVFLFSCSPKKENRSDSSNQKSATIVEKELAVEKVDSESWIDSFPENIKKLKDSFTGNTSQSFSCGIINKYLVLHGTRERLETKDLVQIDSLTCNNLFGDHESLYGNFCSSYFYSIEKPFLGFYPVTVIQGFGVDERPLMLVLFDSNGKFINSIEVADSYGEAGGCLSSKFVNDSTLIRKFKWDELVGVDSLGVGIMETTTKLDTVIFDRTGKYRIYE
jgi:hypothetical protein